MRQRPRRANRCRTQPTARYAFTTVIPTHKARLLANDCLALVAAATAHHQLDASDVLRTIDVPCLILASGPRDAAFERTK
jgi:hypothetical protein